MSGCKAPVGGHVSPVNGQWYEGGQFMPVHGLFCGKAGAKRLKKWESFKECRRVDAGGEKLFVVTLNQSRPPYETRRYEIGAVMANSESEAVQAFADRTGWHLQFGERLTSRQF